MFGPLVTSYIREQSLIVSKSYVVPPLYLQRLSSQTHRYLFTASQETQRLRSSYFLQAIQRHHRPATVRHELTLLKDKSNCTSSAFLKIRSSKCEKATVTTTKTFLESIVATDPNALLFAYVRWENGLTRILFGSLLCYDDFSLAFTFLTAQYC